MDKPKLILANEALAEELYHEAYAWGSTIHPKYMLEEQHMIWIVEFLANKRGFTQFEERADYGR